VRAVNPFSYFVDHASQLRGFGGDRPSPDPQYCFHTRYETVRPGRAIFSLKLDGAQATQGEMTVRVHAYRPDFGGMPSLAAGNRLDLASPQQQELSVAVPFHAVSGVEYALYGFFSEPTDMTVERVDVFLDEPEGDAEVEIAPPQSLLARAADPAEAGPATGLSHHGKIDIARPVSQDCTWSQLETGGSVSDRLRRWREAICLTALTAYDINLPGLDGWVAGEASGSLRADFAARRFALSALDSASLRDSGGFADVILWPEGPNVESDGPTRWAELLSWVERLKLGGFAVVGVQYRPDVAHPVDPARNTLRQWAQRLIGKGYSVAPLAFADYRDLATDEAGIGTCCLIVERQ
jgi:hypothetical protein